MLKPNSAVTTNLIRARELIADEKNWGPYDMEPGLLCALEAVAVSRRRDRGAWSSPCNESLLLGLAGKELFGDQIREDYSIYEARDYAWHVNDTFGHAAVMRMFTRAIELSILEGE